MSQQRISIVSSGARLSWGLALALPLAAAGACDDGAGGRGGPGYGLGDDDDKADDGDSTVSEIQEGFDRPLSDAAAYLRNDSNWVEEDEPAGEPDDGEPPSGDGGATDAGSCAGSCGDIGSDDSCYCDAECSGNGDCCADYGQHCGGSDDGGDSGDGGDSTDGGDGGGGGGPAGTCIGSCGGIGSDNVCYCDAECAANGDCCDDYTSVCGGGGDGGGGAPATCAGYCGGSGSDSSCYCDDACLDNGDCCDDYAPACAADVQDFPDFDLQALPQVAASNGACWGVIADPIDVDQVITHAAAGGALLGGTCVAVMVVPAGATAAPTAGLSVGAAAVACSGAALTGVAAGTVSAIVGQKMGNIAECSASVIEEAFRVFAWGTGKKDVPVPVFGTPTNPGNCTPDEHRGLQDDVNSTCKNAGQRSCVPSNACETIATKIDLAAQCIGAREKINTKCFSGGDSGHNEAIQQEVNLQNKCFERASALGC